MGPAPSKKRTAVAKDVNRVLWTVLVLCAFAAFGPAVAQPDGWRTYENSEWGYQLEYPEFVFSTWEEAPVNGGAIATTPDRSARLLIFGGPNVWSGTIEQIADELSVLEEVKRVTYRRVAANWFVLSGYLVDSQTAEPATIFYQRVTFSPDRQRLTGFSLEYPESMRSTIDSMIARIGNSLRLR